MALAAADAAEARSNRHVRRAYGSGGSGAPYPIDNGYPVGGPMVPSGAVSSVPSPSPTPLTPEAEVAPSPTPSVPAAGDYGNGYGAAPPASSSSSSQTPEAAVSSSSSSGPAVTPSGGVYPPSGVPDVPTGAVPSTGTGVPSVPAGVVPSSSAIPSGAVPSGPAGGVPSSGVPVMDATASASSSMGYPAYPTGTGSAPSPDTPMSDMVTKTIYSTQVMTKTACPSTRCCRWHHCLPSWREP
ncbi:predicted protein [Plenodomus lingam JN3]|uniref:Predicted protein n=1 Tax=Leptosphaeria maculans (strain JN3 / isolate v23.1.3 / race Av1-4-5-6-7-8) TaxID=985895 RepID=E5R4T5_LEPMJ|nr:predicted protein [Plenodomus lingam JN3]CBX92208.1 predicted protein [Plenodomus lingam JN3]